MQTNNGDQDSPAKSLKDLATAEPTNREQHLLDGNYSVFGKLFLLHYKNGQELLLPLKGGLLLTVSLYF